MRPTPNPEQRRAIEWGDGNLAVSAGAGSGKTAVLALRVARAVAQGVGRRGPLDLAGVAAITFTKKAAGELAERVRRELLHAGEVDAARRVDEAWISTIDGLCGRILRRHALDVGVDPRYRTASEVDTGILSGEVLDELEAQACAAAGPIADLFDRYEPDMLRDAVHEAYGRVRAMGATVGQIRVAEAEMSVGEALAAWSHSLDALAEAIREGGGSGVTREANAAAVERARALVVSTHDIQGLEQAHMLRDGLAGIKFSASADADAVKQVKTDVERLLSAVGSVVVMPLAQAFIDLLGRYEVAYTEAKQQAGVLDYSDVVTSTARLLAKYPEVAESLREDLGLVMVDEFQDTNRLRLKAIEPLCSDNLCVVGDDKQSIYRFQFADVEVFRDLRERIGDTVALDQNYRSRSEILAFVNQVFGSDEFFGSDLLKLRAARGTPDIVAWTDGAPRVETVEVQCSEGWDKGPRVAEAAAVASRAAKLVEQGVDPEGIVVLLSGMTHAREYAFALRDAGVEAQVVSGERLSESQAVTHIRSFLRVLALASDDKAMIDALSGPLFGLTPDGLIALHVMNRRSLFEAVRDVAAEEGACGLGEGDRSTIVRFVRIYEALTVVAARDSVSRVIQRLCELTEYDLVLALKGSEGEHEWSQILRLKRLAVRWQEGGYGGVGGFLEHLSAMERYGEREPAGPSSSSLGAVRIMSIHASKGLQFPVVIVGRLGGELVRAQSNDIVLERIDGDPTLAMVPPRTGHGGSGVRASAVQRVRDRVKELERDEALRLLYVAFTRAEDALILVGANVRGKKGLSAQKGLGLVLSALGDPAPGAVDVGEGSLLVQRISTDEIGDVLDQAVLGDTGDFTAVKVVDRCTPGDLVSVSCDSIVPGWRPESVSYSSLQQYDDCPFSFYADRVLGLRRLRPARSESARATEIGSAVHEVLEHLTASNQDVLVRAAVERHRLNTEGEARLRNAIASFESSAVASRLLDADRVIREARIAVSFGQTDLVGSIDAVAWEGDRALVIDYKTGKDKRLSESAERMSHYRLQGECYALAAFAAGARAVEVQFLFLEQEAHNVGFEFGCAESGDIRSAIERRIDGMTAGLFPLRERYDVHVCGGCSAFGSPCSMKEERR